MSVLLYLGAIFSVQAVYFGSYEPIVSYLDQDGLSIQCFETPMTIWMKIEIIAFYGFLFAAILFLFFAELFTTDDKLSQDDDERKGRNTMDFMIFFKF